MKYLTVILASLLPLASISAQDADLNYDETKVPAYTLPNMLISNSGKHISTAKQWEKQRRPELLEMFASQMYGRTPQEKIRVAWQVVSENPAFMDGRATARQVKFIFSGNGKTVEAMLLLLLPNHPKGSVPVFICYNFKGNHSTCADPSIALSSSFARFRAAGHPDWERGCQASRWDFNQIIDRGYAVATMFCEDIFHDNFNDATMEQYSVATLFNGYQPDGKAPDRWQAMGVWAWGSSRIADYLETVNRVDKNKIILMGHSRHGKAALWAGAQDERFSIVISNNSGCCGAALSRREYGEDINRILRFRHWFCPQFDSYAHREPALPMDQHELVALIAPRKAYIASAVQDLGADPKGEYLAGYHASPAYTLYGLKGLENENQPPVNQPVMNDIGYHIRSGGHDVTDYDWTCYMNFADKHFGKPE